jgi:hypothetical protein
MKIWVDDVRPVPEGYVGCKNVITTKKLIELVETRNKFSTEEQEQIELIDLDHDAGEYSHAGGDYISILNWLEETGRNYPIRIHSMNPVGVENMRRIIRRNGWTEVI